MKINWKVRAKNKLFWLAFIPAALLVAQIVAAWFGYHLPVDVINAEISKFIVALFSLLTLLGIVVDHTTDGVSDSERALRYKEPRKDVI